MKYVSIDPGKGGCLFLIENSQPVEFKDMPMTEKGKLIDPVAIVKILEDWGPEAVVVEKVNAGPRMGSSAAYNFGSNSYGLVCICAGLGMPCETITPQRWKAFHGLLKKDKDACRLLALSKFTQLHDALKRKGDVDRADALMMGLAWEALR